VSWWWRLRALQSGRRTQPVRLKASGSRSGASCSSSCPLLFIERGLTRDIRTTKEVAQEAVTAAQQAVKEIAHLRQAPMSDAMSKAAGELKTQAARTEGDDVALAERARAHPTGANVTELLRRACDTPLMSVAYNSRGGVVTPFDTRRGWYVRLQMHWDEPPGTRLSVSLGKHDWADKDALSVNWRGASPPNEPLAILLDLIHKETHRPGGEAELALALDVLIGFVGSALVHTHDVTRERSLKRILAPVDADWFLTKRGLESFAQPGTLVHTSDLERKRAWRALLKGVPWRTIQAARQIDDWLTRPRFSSFSPDTWR
jgi:hypothetical protein